MGSTKPSICIGVPGMYPKRRQPKEISVPDLKVTNGVPIQSKQNIEADDELANDFDDFVLSTIHACQERKIPPKTSRSDEGGQISSDLSKKLSHSTSSLTPKAVHSKSVQIEFERTGNYQDVGRPSLKGGMKKGGVPTAQKDEAENKTEVTSNLPLILTTNLVSQNATVPITERQTTTHSDKIKYIHPRGTPRKDGKLEWTDVKNNSHIQNAQKEKKRSKTAEHVRNTSNDLEKKLTNLTNEVNTMKERVDQLERQGSLLSMLSTNTDQQPTDRYNWKNLFSPLTKDQTDSKDFFALYSYTLRKKPFPQSSTFLVPPGALEPTFLPDQKQLKIKGETVASEKSSSRESKRSKKNQDSRRGKSITRKYREHIEKSKTPGEIALLMGKENNRLSNSVKSKSKSDKMGDSLDNVETNTSNTSKSADPSLRLHLPYLPMQEITFSSKNSKTDSFDDQFAPGLNRRQANTLYKRTVRRPRIAGDLGLKFEVVKLPQIPKLADRRLLIMSDKVKAHYASLEEYRRSSYAPDPPPGSPISYGYNSNNWILQGSQKSSSFPQESPVSSLSRYSSLSSDSELQRLSEQLQNTKPKGERLHINLTEIMKTGSENCSSSCSNFSDDDIEDEIHKTDKSSFRNVSNTNDTVNPVCIVSNGDINSNKDHSFQGRTTHHDQSQKVVVNSKIQNLVLPDIREQSPSENTPSVIPETLELVTDQYETGYTGQLENRDVIVNSHSSNGFQHGQIVINIQCDNNEQNESTHYDMNSTNISAFSGNHQNDIRCDNEDVEPVQSPKQCLSIPKCDDVNHSKYENFKQLGNDTRLHISDYANVNGSVESNYDHLNDIGNKDITTKIVVNNSNRNDKKDTDVITPDVHTKCNNDVTQCNQSDKSFDSDGDTVVDNVNGSRDTLDTGCDMDLKDQVEQVVCEESSDTGCDVLSHADSDSVDGVAGQQSHGDAKVEFLNTHHTSFYLTES